MAFTKLKTLLRQAPERTRDGLWNRIGELLDRFAPDECANYPQAAGYGVSLSKCSSSTEQPWAKPGQDRLPPKIHPD